MNPSCSQGNRDLLPNRPSPPNGDEEGNYDVAGLGTILVDQQVFLDTYPALDTKTEVTSYRFQVGGPVPTALVLLSRFGKTCQFAGRWGKDTFGELIESDLRRERVHFDDASCARADSTGFAQVWVDRV